MKIFCIGRNYADHAKELQNEIPDKPIVFMKPPTAILKDDKAFYHPDFSTNIQHEVEIVLKISKNGKYVDEKFAHNYYKEFSVGIDFTARDLQTELKAKGQPWEIAKAFDNSAVIGQFMPIAAYDLSNLNFSLKSNGQIVQQGNTSLMLFNFDRLIAYISQYFMLQTGDLIYTGTPAGVAKVKLGDILEGFVEEKKVFRTEIK
ncbi:MAG: fumarylacetoacetate hydrolase family protein [Bacteroidetes bacterium]|nr:fumarylacetoacetate hydrolase family protein [Bacteroidota bacterium]